MDNDLQYRIAVLQGEIERLRTRLHFAIAIALVTFGALALASWAPRAEDHIKAKTISLMNSAGTERLKLYATDEAAGLVIYGSNRKPTVSLDSFSNGPALSLFDSLGRRRSRSVVYKDTPVMEFLRPDEQPYFRIP